jgi:hypothetical protein
MTNTTADLVSHSFVGGYQAAREWFEDLRANPHVGVNRRASRMTGCTTMIV